ncbi:MAG TPA: HD domain-containing phosphohydrolase [Verrucomicrobiae bacterium]|nr:HD domain-containing phosphohydrolase [Verrucomicrobiae bacterium]
MIEGDPHPLAVFGALLSADVTSHALGAAEGVGVRAGVRATDVATAAETLLDRYALSLTLGKPVGIALWAARYAREFGRVGALDVAAAVSRAIANAAAVFGVEGPALDAFLRELDDHVQRELLEKPHGDGNPAERAAHVLVSMLQARDGGCGSHAQAVAHWARRLCAELALSEEETAFVALCALLHDVGMIAVPERILGKSGALTGVEASIVRDHAAAGERILRGIPELAGCADVVRSHHERWDGQGYPDRLRGDTIPFEARLVAVVDAFHAMISDRPHRLAIAPRVALEIIAAGSGTQWDPGIVDALLAMLSPRVSEQDTEHRISSA